MAGTILACAVSLTATLWVELSFVQTPANGPQVRYVGDIEANTSKRKAEPRIIPMMRLSNFQDHQRHHRVKSEEASTSKHSSRPTHDLAKFQKFKLNRRMSARHSWDSVWYNLGRGSAPRIFLPFPATTHKATLYTCRSRRHCPEILATKECPEFPAPTWTIGVRALPQTTVCLVIRRNLSLVPRAQRPLHPPCQSRGSPSHK